MTRIFISYRRDDSAGHAGRIYDHLMTHFGQGQVFMDVDAIGPGVDFVKVVQEAVGACDCLIAVIGTEWLTASDSTETGGRRLDDPEDLVRVEIATALERGISVMPVLVQGAVMPRSTDLPQDLKELANRNALELNDTRFRSDVERLRQAIDPLSEGLRVERRLATILAADVAGYSRLMAGIEPGTSATPRWTVRSSCSRICTGWWRRARSRRPRRRVRISSTRS